ncbi:sensor histidine kinase [Nocardioides sp. Kera G14]|uniref:sensor histidine kinase n=1 Tax=Nocardioides sp. Kera G14 TaxID=2884264 RepID=UPI001D11FDD4|nr:histidine kinase [Nocardioides sp. Kera G14]UDY24002.1 histidine kinase [Nocardioides sp. Kera G14]
MGRHRREDPAGDAVLLGLPVPTPRDGDDSGDEAGVEADTDLVAADRDRIARDLHDLVIQRLYATGLQLQAASKGSPEEMAAALGDGARSLDLTIRDLRATIFELGRGIGPRLTDEVRALAEEYAGVLGFLPQLRFTGPVDTLLSERARDQVLLTLREALSNVARHAQATNAAIGLHASPAWFMLRVSDNGTGPAEPLGAASGLANARQRATRLGGVMRFGGVEPQGACLVWIVPVGS